MTVVHGLFLLVLAVAAVLRLGFLDALPLSSEEARQALAVWEIWQAEEVAQSTAPVSPAYFTLSAILSAFFGASDAMARLAPALFGVIFVALPWLWRARLGTAGAMAVSMLLAVSPTMTMTSATAGGDSMALVAALLLFIAWMRFRAAPGKQWLLVAAVALGLGLATAPLFYSALLTLTVAWGAQRVLTPSDEESHSGDGVGISPSQRRRFLVVFAVTFLLIATCFLWRPAGLGNAAGQLGLWMMHFDVTAGLQALILPLLALGRYELVVVGVGAAAIFWAAWRGLPLPLFLVYWFASALLLTLLQQGALYNTVLLVLPSYLLIGLWIRHATRLPAGDV
ncbi:MAG: glycosyltransferase family 39 protein, partial [Chloroflexota bacterium]